MQRDLLEHKPTRKEIQDLRNKRTGLLIFQLSWILVFVCLVVVNWQLRITSPSWPPAGVEPISPVLPTLATVALAASTFLVRRAVQAMKADDARAFLSRWWLALVMGAVFVGLMLYEWATIPYSQVYSDVFRMMTGFHVVHAVAIGLFMYGVGRNAHAGAYHSGNFWPVEGAAGLWYFVLVAWLLFYAALYLV